VETVVDSASEFAETLGDSSATENAMADDDEVIVEDAADESSKAGESVPVPKMKTVVVDEWLHLNPQPPLWMRSVIQIFVEVMLTAEAFQRPEKCHR